MPEWTKELDAGSTGGVVGDSRPAGVAGPIVPQPPSGRALIRLPGFMASAEARA